jgi:hypothetical protein
MPPLDGLIVRVLHHDPEPVESAEPQRTLSSEKIEKYFSLRSWCRSIVFDPEAQTRRELTTKSWGEDSFRLRRWAGLVSQLIVP